ncbi:MAG: AAA family ATPase [Spirochaetales bacterium]|jgi:DNA sulfur modification protein DndD|nr:AAA family ATPase [Spirochaetales bacterium]
MIKNLRLEKFGKFLDKDFSFAPVTLFYGENEAGKTTLFDALLDGLCNPRGTTLSGKRLSSRYGNRDTQRLSRVVFEGEPFSIDEGDFLNLFAVRSGMISLEIDKNSGWMNAVKASLFSGGIDPQAAAVKLLGEIGGGRIKGSLNTKAAEIKAELKSLEAEHEKAEEERRECLGMEKNVRDMDAKVRENEKESAALKAQLAEMDASLEQQGLIREKKNAESVLTDIAESFRKNTELKNYSRYTPEEQEKIRLLAEEAGTRKTEAEKAAAAENDAMRNRQRFVEEKNRRAADRDRAEKLKTLAEGLKAQIVPREKLIQKKTRLEWKKAPVIAAIVVLIAAALAGFLGPMAYKLWFLGGGVVAASFLALISASHKMWEDTSSLEAAINFVRESWKKEAGEDSGVVYEEVVGVLERARERAAAAEENFQSIQKQADANDEEIARLALRGREAEQTRDAARRSLKDMLDAAGVTSGEEYASRCATKAALRGRCAELEEKLRRACAEYQTLSAGELENFLLRRTAEIREKITEQELPAAEVQRRENIRREKKWRLEALLAEEKKNREDLGRKDGTVQGQFRGIPERIAACEKGMAEKTRRLAEIEKELDAAKIAQEIFASLSEDSASMLTELSREISETFSAFTGGERPVSLEGFSADNARVTDAAGETQEAGKVSKDAEAASRLSSGTRDAFLLAARLVLARKSSGRASGRQEVIILDEPFITLDRQRTHRALGVLEDFRKKTGWQIVLFTKDEVLEKQAREIFGSSLAVHRLAVETEKCGGKRCVQNPEYAYNQDS